MQESKGDLWSFHEQGYWVVVTTNGDINKKGVCVMGKGVALEAASRFPDLPFRLAREIRRNGNVPVFFHDLRIITLPTKKFWWDKSDINLIASGLKYLSEQVVETTYMTRPGCGNGRLNWEDVRPVCEEYLDERFIVVEL